MADLSPPALPASPPTAKDSSVYSPASQDTAQSGGQREMSLKAVTLGLWQLVCSLDYLISLYLNRLWPWQLAIRSAIKVASVTKQNGNDVVGSNPRSLPPLPSLPPVGPGRRCRPRSLSLSGRPSTAQTPPQARRSHLPLLQLGRSQSVADIFTSAMAAAKLFHPDNSFARNTRCQECNQKFSLIFRRHHCRFCKRSVCAYCSTYHRLKPDTGLAPIKVDRTPSRPATPTTDGTDVKCDVMPEEGEELPSLQTNASLPLQGILHRVCRKCLADKERRESVYCRSWREEFCTLRRFFKQGRSGDMGSEPDSNPLLPPRMPRVPPECEPLARTFVEEYKKSAGNSRTLFQSTSASLNAGFQYALMTPSQKPCGTCGRLLRFPIERKTCALCQLTFCRHCSSRDLLLTLPRALHPGDVLHEVAQVVAKVLAKEEAAALDKEGRSDPTLLTAVLPLQRYRVCHKCRENVTHAQKAMSFNDKLAVVQAELMELQQQIAAVVDEQDVPATGCGISRWPSVRSVHQYTSAEDEMVGEAVSQRVANKLLDRFFIVYLELERLQPQTVTQGVLFKHVKQAMTSFYMTQRSVSSKRFNKKGRLSSLPPSGSASPFL